MEKTFNELPKKLQEKILRLKTIHSVLKGKEDPNEDAWKFIRSKKPKTSKQWRFIPYLLMRRIDINRKKMGLTPVYDVDKKH